MTKKYPRGPRYTDLINSLPNTVPFVGPEVQERERGRQFIARLGANENVFEPSPKAIEAMRNAECGQWMYGDSENYDLRMALAQHCNVAFENVVVGEGIDGLLGYLVRLLVSQGDPVVTSEGAYPTLNYHVNGYGGDVFAVPYNGYFEDPVALVEKAKEVGAKLIYLANPDNPMGTVHDAKAIQSAIDAVPDGSLLVLDEAYIEFAPNGSAPAFNANDPRVIRMRTFSKAYALAGARVGYAVGHADLIQNFEKVRNHFGVNRTAQIGALAALHDQGYLNSLVAKVENARTEIERIATDNGLKIIPSATSFVTIDCGHDGAFAKSVLSNLLDQDLFVRMPFTPTQNHCIRISAGRAQDLMLFAQAFPKAMEAARKEHEL